MRILSYLIIVVFFISSCGEQEKEQLKQQSSEYQLLSTAWYQLSAERKALYYQAYNIAKKNVDDIITNKNISNPAVVLDIDETVLDNSPYQAWCIESDSLFSQRTWNKWVLQAKAEALTGALDFTNYAKSKGVQVFYISNRHVSEMEQTIVNLRTAGFPNASTDYILLKEKTSDKTARRAAVSQNYTIALLIGDNLGDFDHLYDNRVEGNAHKIVEEQKELFGNKFIILPNPMYGSWEKPYRNADETYINTLKRNLRKFKLN